MSMLDRNDCSEIINVYTSDHFNILEFKFDSTDEDELGLLSSASRLYIKIESGSEVNNLKFFVKTFPSNAFHYSMVKKSRCFFKEVAFFKTIISNLNKYISTKSVPRCYFADENKCIVLEDLSLYGYKTSTLQSTFDLRECEVALNALAELHAASLLHEKANNLNMDEEFPDLMFISLFAEGKDHPGNKHLLTGIRALECVLEKYFNNVQIKARQNVVSFLTSLPRLLKPSKKFKNAISHNDLWCNNIMFKYDSDTAIEACLIDFQLFAYNPPALDVLVLIYLNTDKQIRKKYLPYLLSYYYSSFAKVIRKHKYDPNSILSIKEFSDSIAEIFPIALGISALYLHYVLLQDEDLNSIVNSEEKMKIFMEEDRSLVVLKNMEESYIYRKRILNVLHELVCCISQNTSFTTLLDIKNALS